LLTNAGGRAGDALVLTKPLGTGAIATAFKRGAAGADSVAAAVSVMTELNASASAAARSAGASAVTDVTGFGLLGHLHELCLASGVSAQLSAEAVPAISGACELLAGQGAVSGGLRRNFSDASGFATFDSGVSLARTSLLCDPMTSGGLLVALDPDRAGQVPGTVIGSLTEGVPGQIEVLP
nr:selenide, water dikinase SelD [Actinomycetota bacterium]